jgi:hypothetical protein
MRTKLTWREVQWVGVEDGEGRRPGGACARHLLLLLRRRRGERAPQNVVDAEG